MMGRTSRRDMDRAMYSASVVDIATCDCNLEAQMMGHPEKKMIQPLLDFDVAGYREARNLFQFPEKPASQ
jgi:hypothetical protein